jgi:hypothetical protein
LNATLPPLGAKPGKPQYRRLDIAYGCFAFVALAACLAPLLLILPITEDDKGALEFILGFPIMFVALVALIAGLVLSVVHRREWPLLAMALASLLFLLTWILSEELGEKTMEVFSIPYLALLIFSCARWFFFIRGKRKRAEIS